MSWRVGVDSGGTFTDVCLFDEEGGDVAVWKVSSTPDDPSRGIAQGVDEGMRLVAPDAGERPAAPVSYFGHGTTVATNALIQHKGVRTGLLTTEGFRDLLEIGRQKRPDLYDLFVDKPPTLVSRDLRLEAPERIRHTGEVETPLNAEAVRAAGRDAFAPARRALQAGGRQVPGRARLSVQGARGLLGHGRGWRPILHRGRNERLPGGADREDLRASRSTAS